MTHVSSTQRPACQRCGAATPPLYSLLDPTGPYIPYFKCACGEQTCSHSLTKQWRSASALDCLADSRVGTDARKCGGGVREVLVLPDRIEHLSITKGKGDS